MGKKKKKKKTEKMIENIIENSLEINSVLQLKESPEIIEASLLGISPDELTFERENENTSNQLLVLREFDFREAIYQNTNAEGTWTSLPTFSSELLEKKKIPLEQVFTEKSDIVSAL